MPEGSVPMLREAFTERLKTAMRAKDTRTVSTVRLILAGAQGPRHRRARHAATPTGIADAEIQRMLQGMVKQRRESIALYEQGNRPDLAQQESEEIAVIESFLPQQMSEDEIDAAATAAIAETGAAGRQGHGQGHGRAERALRRAIDSPRRRDGQAAAGLTPRSCNADRSHYARNAWASRSAMTADGDNAMAFPPGFLDELRSRVSLAELVGRARQADPARPRACRALPVPQREDAVLHVVEDKGFFHCFGCGAHGDAIGFVMRADSLDFPEAVERLAGEAGLAVPQPTPQERERAQRQKTLLDALEAAAAFYEAQLWRPRARRARDYLTARGLDEETIRRFRLGWAPDDRQALRRGARPANFPSRCCSRPGCCAAPERRRQPYDYFRGRVMFPIGDRAAGSSPSAAACWATASRNISTRRRRRSSRRAACSTAGRRRGQSAPRRAGAPRSSSPKATWT